MHGRIIGKILSVIKEYGKRGDLFAIFFLAVVLRLVFLSQVVDQIGFDGLSNLSPDAKMYIKTAQSIIGKSDSSEPGLFIFGPGYSSFLALNFLAWGNRISIILILQILLSAVSALLIYRLSKIITASYSAAIVAAVLFALSYTSITLSISPLSDTLYLFLFLVGLITFLEALRRESSRLMIISGLMFGIAILTRSVGQFWPLIMVIYGWYVGPEIDSWPHKGRRRRLKLSILGAGIAIAIMLCWIGRNLIVHDVPTLSSAGAIGLYRIADQTRQKMKGEDSVLAVQCSQPDKPDSNKADNSLKAQYDFNLCYAKSVFLANPAGMLITYLKNSWINVNEISYYHRALLPDNKDKMIKKEQFIIKHRLNYLNFIICFIGLTVLLIQKKYQPLIILAGIYLYYALLSGLTLWQGSRIFFPGQTAAAILVAFVLVCTYESIVKLIRRNSGNKIADGDNT